MKHSLANFPDPNSRELQSNATFAVACLHWKEGFEKELREQKQEWEQRWKQTPFPHVNLDALIFQAGIGLVSEILGDTEAQTK